MTARAHNPDDPIVAIVEALPPPYGGVSTHIDRLLRRLDEEKIPYRLYDTLGRSFPERSAIPGGKSAGWVVRFLLTFPEAVVHFHSARPLLMIGARTLLPLRHRRMIVSFHSERPLRWYREADPLRQAAYRWAMRGVAHSFSANQRITDWLIEMGITPERVTTVAAFIPPTEGETTSENIDDFVRDFLETHSPIIGSQGFFGYFQDGDHVYSFDHLASLLRSVKQKHPTAGLYTLISGIREERHRQEIHALRRELGLENDWVFLQGILSSVALFSQTDLFIRPTMTDGDSVSVRECLHLGVPVVASDCVPRPTGSVVVRTRDLDQLVATAISVLDDLEGHRRTVESCPREDGSLPLIKVYREEISARTAWLVRQEGVSTWAR
jgi:glycosyltransferase involved in cell wall biosynthesis